MSGAFNSRRSSTVAAKTLIGIWYRGGAPTNFARPDSASSTGMLLTVGDGEAGWQTVVQLITALERSGLASLQ
ncbi:MAG: hypothetical protein WA376_18340, partial [Terrimicrobiaceae bacterium]